MIKIVEDFVSEQDALSLMEEMKSPSKINPYPEYYKDRNGGTAFPYNNRVMDILKKYSVRANHIQQEFFNLKDKVVVTKAFGSWWQPGQSGSPHIDAIEKEPFIEYSTVIYLNDDYEGGEIYFPKQNFEHRPKSLSAIFFPGNKYEYLHGVKEITKGNRFTALYMQSTKVDFADPDFEVL